MFVEPGLATFVCSVGARSCLVISNYFVMRHGSSVSPPHPFNVELKRHSGGTSGIGSDMTTLKGPRGQCSSSEKDADSFEISTLKGGVGANMKIIGSCKTRTCSNGADNCVKTVRHKPGIKNESHSQWNMLYFSFGKFVKLILSRLVRVKVSLWKVGV